MRSLSLCLAVSLGAGLLGCSNKSTPATQVTLPSFSDITTAPPAIQKAAAAVVRIETENGLATGSFLSATGLLLTNNHVLGTGICPIEGCYAQLTFGYQRGTKVSQPQTVFVVPTAVSVGLDMAVVQVYEKQGGAQLSSPSFLTIKPMTPAELVGTHVTLVGHPEGHLKKWTAGEVYDTDGDWIFTSAYLLPGNSGSPILDDTGAVVGLVHRGPTGEGYFSPDGALTFSLGTASSALSPALTAPLPPEMVSVAAPTTQAAVVANDLVFLNAHVPTATLTGGTSLSVVTALGASCDTALAGSYASPDDLTAGLQPCYDALSWIQCQGGTTPTTSVATVCPSAADIPTWQSRFTQMNALTVAMNDQVSLYPLSFGIASLQSSTSAGQAAGASAITTALQAASTPIDMNVANYLAAFAVPSYAGTTVASYVQGYAKVPDYAIQATDIASAASWLAQGGAITNDQAIQLVQALYADPAVDVGDKLYMEDVLYAAGVLQ